VLFRSGGTVHLFFADNDFNILNENNALLTEMYRYFDSARNNPINEGLNRGGHFRLSFPTARKTDEKCAKLVADKISPPLHIACELSPEKIAENYFAQQSLRIARAAELGVDPCSAFTYTDPTFPKDTYNYKAENIHKNDNYHQRYRVSK
jgi:hypothetical protein